MTKRNNMVTYFSCQAILLEHHADLDDCQFPRSPANCLRGVKRALRVCYIVEAMKPVRSFASDNNAGVHPKVLQAIAAVNRGHVVGYGDDAYTEAAIRKFKQHFGSDVEVFVVFNGTAANCLSLKALTEPYHAVICGEAAHIYTDECGAPEKFTGCKLIPIPISDGKLTVEAVRPVYHG